MLFFIFYSPLFLKMREFVSLCLRISCPNLTLSPPCSPVFEISSVCDHTVRLSFHLLSKVAIRMLTEKTFSSCWLCLSRGFASQIHGTFTVFHYMSVSLMCRHVASQIKLTVESPLTKYDIACLWCSGGRRSFVATNHSSSSNGTCIPCGHTQMLIIAVHISLVPSDIFPPRRSKRASRMIARVCQSRETLLNDPIWLSSTATKTHNQTEDIWRRCCCGWTACAVAYLS